MNALEFFQLSEGVWRSHRITHHLLLRRSETGNTEIEVKVLVPSDPQVIEICQLHHVSPEEAIGGCFVQWHGAMDWDHEEGDNHQGSTVFVLVPHTDEAGSGKLLRERGYAESIPVVSQYQVDAHNGLVLTTQYDTISSQERFWFANPNLRLRTTTVKSFGGFNTTSFCAESKLSAESQPIESPINDSEQPPLIPTHSWLGW